MKSWIEVSGERLQANFRAIRNVAGAEVLAVVKANAYGHGATLCAPVLAEAGAHWLGVSDVQDGAAVRASLDAARFPNTRLLAMSGMEPGDAPAMIAHRLTPVAWTREHLTALEAAAETANTTLAVHVEVDTGMSRQGVAPGEELAALLQCFGASKHLQLEGVFGHLCCSEISGSPATVQARAKLGEALAQVSAAYLKPRYVHLENSSGIDDGGSAEWLRAQAASLRATPMVRPGLSVYGYALPLQAGPEHGRIHDLLTPVMTWKTRILGLREIEAGATVGYGATFTATRTMRLALLPVGYADGFRREASSGLADNGKHANGWVMIAGERAAVVGRVSMNLTVVDVTEIANVSVGDEAVLLGEGVSADDHARWAGTISYEILCGVRGERVLR